MHDHLPLICFVVCDNGPAAHFADFASQLISLGTLRIDIYANESVFSKFKDLSLVCGIHVFRFMLDGLEKEEEYTLAADIITMCVTRGAQTIIVDIANKFSVNLQTVFDGFDFLPYDIRFWCYYDNPEEYVAGGYSIRSSEMIKLSRNILFANMNLVKKDSKIFSLPNVQINLQNKTIRGIGYYTIEKANQLYEQRQTERITLRENFQWDNDKYLFAYFGGNNQVYYEQAFPKFLSLLSTLDRQMCDDIIFVIHQHPAAKLENRDGILLQQWLLKNRSIQVMLSPWTSDEVQIMADGILYYQTSMAPIFALIGLPIMQVAHETYEDILVKHKLCEKATSSIEFMDGLKVFKEKNQSMNSIEQKQLLIYDAIGYRFDWLQNLENLILKFE